MGSSCWSGTLWGSWAPPLLPPQASPLGLCFSHRGSRFWKRGRPWCSSAVELGPAGVVPQRRGEVVHAARLQNAHYQGRLGKLASQHTVGTVTLPGLNQPPSAANQLSIQCGEIHCGQALLSPHPPRAVASPGLSQRPLSRRTVARICTFTHPGRWTLTCSRQAECHHSV